jgi:hypothetical protein
MDNLVIKSCLRFVFACALVVTPTFAQKQVKLVKPSFEMQKLAVMVGKWRIETTYKRTVLGPAAKKEITIATCEWFPGKHFLLIHETQGQSKELDILGYNGEERTYTFYNITSDDGKPLAGNFWINKDGSSGSDFESRIGGKLIKFRGRTKWLSATTKVDSVEFSENGTVWASYLENRWIKIK